jgi:predicted ATPase
MVQASPSNLVLPRSPLIRRDHEVATVQHLLLQDEIVLLTLTGPGGIGKTRLALQVKVVRQQANSVRSAAPGAGSDVRLSPTVREGRYA